MDHLKSAIRHMNPQMTSMSVLPAKSPAKPPAKSPAKSPSKPHNADKVRLQQVCSNSLAFQLDIAGMLMRPNLRALCYAMHSSHHTMRYT